jgi:predicted DCC family thiol-disulfide oxidoreductase YuxK
MNWFYAATVAFREGVAEIAHTPEKMGARMRPPYSHDPAVPRFADDKPVIIFDGYCALCPGFAAFVPRHEAAVRYRLEGSIRMADELGSPWRVGFRVLPPAWRDRLYQTVARNRLHWFGRRATCYRPDPRFADRFSA